MKYTVRSPHGDLTYASFGELEQAFFAGLIDPEDKVQEEGSAAWRRADSFPVLRRPRPLTGQEQQAQKFWLALGVVFGSVALWAVQTKGVEGNARYVHYGVAVVAAGLLAAVMGRLARASAKRKR